eukprot:9005280-Alexandrium_andersonii.AAC.1
MGGRTTSRFADGWLGNGLIRGWVVGQRIESRMRRQETNRFADGWSGDESVRGWVVGERIASRMGRRR